MLESNNKNFIEIYRYIIVGLCSVLIDFLFYYIFIYFEFLNPNYSKRLSFIMGAIFAFYVNRTYVFKVDEKKLSQYILFSVLYFTSFILNSIIHDYVFLISGLTLISFLSATFVSKATNFIGQKFIIFKKKS